MVKMIFSYDNVLRAILLRKISEFPSGTHYHNGIFTSELPKTSSNIGKNDVGEQNDDDDGTD